ncbi:2,3-bisphosphoglycerate-independent phosphoglycerate mutase, partial [Candidatus Saccharibacteria bacterium]|nr:2,3-bisphosphoglycerate-independent phosphoglycerate mutase [Candidatus Saccharibacteria bacterium]
MDKLQYDGPVVLAILDGVGLAPDGPGNAVSRARTPFLGTAAREYLHVALNASAEAVGLTPGQMGNSEVGHNTIGSGQIMKHGIAAVNAAFDSGEVFNSEAWRSAVTKALNGGTLHFAGIFSDGGVHSHIAHLEQMIVRA